MNSRNTTAALPVAIALIGALALPTGERERISVKELFVPAVPAGMEEFYGDDDTLSICSFNIQFLGNSKRRDDPALAAVVQGFDIVLVQELVSPPYEGTFPNGAPFKPDAESAEFFDLMVHLGFEYVLSEEDTGTGEKNHKNGSATEWWVAFYNPVNVQVADDLPGGFLAKKRANHKDYERVPFAFPFRTTDASMDFVLISVHLMPGKGRASVKRRNEELTAIGEWVDKHDDVEKDFIIVGDMNIEGLEELKKSTPQGFLSLNDEVVPTNTNVNGRKPYDHAMYKVDTGDEIDKDYDFKVIDLLNVMEGFWTSETLSYPGKNPYDHNPFRAFYSDHHPVVFHMNYPEEDDD